MTSVSVHQELNNLIEMTLLDKVVKKSNQIYEYKC